MYYISKPDPFIKRVVKECYPSYTGKKFKLSSQIPSRLESYWSGGSRTFYCFYELKTGKSYDIGSNHPFFEKNKPRCIEKLPEGIIIVSHSYYRGKDMGITIYANKSDLTPLIPENPIINEHEKIVLKYTSKYKNTYGGRKHIRFKEAARDYGILREEWVSAQKSLIEKKLLRKNKSITPKGRNTLN